MIVQRPDLLWILPAAVLVLVVAFLLHVRRRRSVVRAFGGAGAARRLVGTDLRRIPLLRYSLVVVSAAALCLAGLGLRPRDPPPLEPSRPVDAVLAVDVSRSMAATDAEPDRLSRARALAHRILESLPSDRIGLVAYAHEAYAIAPPTADHAVVRYFLDALEPGLVPDADQGSRPGEALGSAADLLRRHGSEDAHRVVILLTDGETHEEEARLLQRAEEAADSGLRVFTVGVGTEEGAALRRVDYRGQDAGPILGPDGAPVVSELAPELLEDVARAGRGRYVAGDAPDDRVIRTLLDAVDRDPPGERGSPPTPWRRDLPHLLGLVALGLLLAESGGEALARRVRIRRRRP